MDEPLAEIAAYFRRKSRVPDQELVRLTAAAREGGSRWDAIAAGCGVRDYHDVTGVAGLPCWKADDTGAELLFSATQYAVEQLTGAQRRWPPLTWVCPGCGQQVTDRAPAGRPVHIEHGHAPGCVRLARDRPMSSALPCSHTCQLARTVQEAEMGVAGGSVARASPGPGRRFGVRRGFLRG